MSSAKQHPDDRVVLVDGGFDPDGDEPGPAEIKKQLGELSEDEIRILSLEALPWQARISAILTLRRLQRQYPPHT